VNANGGLCCCGTYARLPRAGGSQMPPRAIAVDVDAGRLVPQQAEQRSEQRRLAGAVAAEHGERFAPVEQ
jgi:hypothetical protein